MGYTVISSTIQEFNGERFCLSGQYFRHNGRSLHRVVWEFFNGSIPDGFHVHHKDKNRANNDISNLEVLDKHEHAYKHACEEERIEHSRETIKTAIEAAKEWHGSEEGKEWHSKHVIESWQKIQPVTLVCEHCGKEYQVKTFNKTGSKYCSNNCKSAARRASGVDNVERTCECCGKTFSVNKYAKIKYCSRECARKVRWG